MHSLVHSVWQTQHQSNPHCWRVHTMCIQPPKLNGSWMTFFKRNIEFKLPSRSVGVRHLGQGFEVTRIVTRLSASHLAWKYGKLLSVTPWRQISNFSYLCGSSCINNVLGSCHHWLKVAITGMTFVNVITLQAIATKYKLQRKFQHNLDM